MTNNADIIAFAVAAEARAEKANPGAWEFELAEIAKSDVPTLARMVVKMAEALQWIETATDGVEGFGDIYDVAHDVRADLTAELKGSQR